MSKKVLVVDDELDIQLYLKAALNDRGYEAVCQEGGQSAIDAAHEHRPDLVVLDIMMPRQSGVSIYRSLRNIPELSRIPIVILSGMGSRKDLQNGKFAALLGEPALPSPDAFLDKPIDLEVLHKTLRALLG